VRDYLSAVLNEVSSESPEAHIASAAQGMTYQQDCPWGKIRCWKPDEGVSIQLKDAKTGAEKIVIPRWQKPTKKAFDPAPSLPTLPPSSRSWSFKATSGSYAVESDSLPDSHYGFLGQLVHGKKKWLIVKIFEFHGLDLVQTAIVEARK